MQGEETHPPGRVDGILLRMIAMLRDFVGHIVDCDDAVEQRDEHKDEEAQREVVQERVEVDVAGREEVSAYQQNDDENARGDHPLADPEARFTKAKDAVPTLAPKALGAVSNAAPKLPDDISDGAPCLLDVVQGHEALANRTRALD